MVFYFYNPSAYPNVGKFKYSKFIKLSHVDEISVLIFKATIS